MINTTDLQGANFRDLKGIVIKEDGITVDVIKENRELVPSGKPLVCNISMFRQMSFDPFL